MLLQKELDKPWGFWPGFIWPKKNIQNQEIAACWDCCSACWTALFALISWTFTQPSLGPLLMWLAPQHIGKSLSAAGTSTRKSEIHPSEASQSWFSGYLKSTLDIFLDCWIQFHWKKVIMIWVDFVHFFCFTEISLCHRVLCAPAQP